MAESGFRLDESALRSLLTSPEGPVYRDLQVQTNRVRNRAISLCPVNNGRLRASIAQEIRLESTGLVGRVGTNVEYALYVHEGTGIYGPNRRPYEIKPRSKKALAFIWKGAPTPPNGRGGKHVYKRVRVKGTRPKPFLRDALQAVQ
jgi:hypothetical protein